MKIIIDNLTGDEIAKFLKHIIKTAKSRGYRQLNLETGSLEFFKPAQQLYLIPGIDGDAINPNYSPAHFSVMLNRFFYYS